MTNFEFLHKYFYLQYQVTFDQILDLGFALVGYCETDPSMFSNFALTNKILSEGEIIQISEKLSMMNRDPAVYFVKAKRFDPLIKLLEKSGFKKGGEDSWMFYDSNIVGTQFFNDIHKIEDKESLEIFLQTFNACYQKGDPQNPYGDSSSFIPAMRVAWERFGRTDRLEYFLCYKEGRPVSVSMLNSFGGIGYVSGVGSLREIRGEGYGKAATMYAIARSKAKGNKLHCLATEEGHYPNEFYKRIGFTTKFTAPIYVLKK